MTTHVYVKAYHNESTERLIKRFSRKVKKEGIIEEVRDRARFVPASKKRRLKKLRRKKIARKIQQQNNP